MTDLILHLLSFFSIFRPQTDKTIFLRETYRSDHQPDSQTSQASDPTIRSKPRSDHYHPNIIPDRKTPPSNQPLKADSHFPNQTTIILDCSASNQHSTPSLLKWYRSGAFLVGWVKGGYIELWMNLTKHTFHTPSA